MGRSWLYLRCIKQYNSKSKILILQSYNRNNPDILHLWSFVSLNPQDFELSLLLYLELWQRWHAIKNLHVSQQKTCSTTTLINVKLEYKLKISNKLACSQSIQTKDVSQSYTVHKLISRSSLSFPGKKWAFHNSSYTHSFQALAWIWIHHWVSLLTVYIFYQ